MRDFNKKCCHNCKHNFLMGCEKLKSVPEYAETLSDGVTTSDIFSEKFLKRIEVQKKYCCDDFSSHWLEYPFAVSEIKKEDIKYNEYDCGTLVKIRPCKDEFKSKTYVGIYLGDLPTDISSSLNNKTKVLTLSTIRNPAIFIPELNQIIFGYESWWGKIESIDELNNITDEDIDNVWYVRLLKSMAEKNKGNENRN